jgi:RNA polymerase sigma-70 factor (ECF subfamily)
MIAASPCRRVDFFLMPHEYFPLNLDTLHVMDDATAIQQCRAGQPGAYRYLVEGYQKQAIGHAIAILGDRDDALDAVQDAFVDAWRRLDSFDMSRRFYPWFYVILRNRCFKLAAGRRRRKSESLEETLIIEPVEEERESGVELEEALMQLEVEAREILTLKYLDGLSYAELAERLQIPVGTVMSRLYKARRLLREAIENINRDSHLLDRP